MSTTAFGSLGAHSYRHGRGAPMPLGWAVLGIAALTGLLIIALLLRG